MPSRLQPPRTTRTARPHHIDSATGLLIGAILTLICATGLISFLLHRIRLLDALLGPALVRGLYDELTGLPNRRSAMDRLDDGPAAMIGFLDLDGFKTVNDLYGHDIGDQLLTVVAQRLVEQISGEGVVARLGGDEFILFWDQVPTGPLQRARQILQAVTEPVPLGDHLTLRPAASLGLAISGEHLNGPTLLAAADSAMYTAKHTGGAQPARVSLYTSDRPPPPADRRRTREPADPPTPSATNSTAGPGEDRALAPTDPPAAPSATEDGPGR